VANSAAGTVNSRDTQVQLCELGQLLRKGGKMMSGSGNTVIITDIRMPLWSMVVFMVKWAIAAIPALVILTGIWWITVALFGNMGMMLGMGR